jgi:hypothetical protein
MEFFPMRILCLFATILIWVGIFHITDYYIIETSLWTELVGLTIAITMLFLTTRNIITNRWAMSTITLFFTVLAWKCTWNLLDYHVASPSLTRELIYMGCGLFLLVIFEQFHGMAKW